MRLRLRGRLSPPKSIPVRIILMQHPDCLFSRDDRSALSPASLRRVAQQPAEPGGRKIVRRQCRANICANISALRSDWTVGHDLMQGNECHDPCIAALRRADGDA